MASPAKNTLSVPVSSSSSPSIPSRPNPKPRNSENGDPMRRSFRGSPFPSDPSRRNSIGSSDKENQIDNVAKAPKGATTKNFMSPTISAASKINPSPRKKILSDKNEVSRSFDKSTHHHQVRSSISFSEVVSIIGDDDKDQISIDERKQIDCDDDVTVTDFDEDCGSKKSGDDDLGFKNTPLPYSFPVFGTQEVDPIVAPYDPKKNYLSPRPQFLHYRPNPRIEQHFDECKQLEGLFSSESSSSETDLSQQEEEVASMEEQVVVEKVEESVEAVKSDVEEKEEVVGESIEEEDLPQVVKQSRFRMSKVVPWVLALGVACLLLVSSVTFTQPGMIQDSPFYKFQVPPEITKSARESFEELSVKLRVWAESSLVYLDKLMSSLGEEEGYGSFQYHNLTDMVDDTKLSDAVFQTSSGEISVAGLLVDSQDWKLDMDTEEENEEAENGVETVYEEDGNGFEEESEGGDVNSEMLNVLDKQTEISMATDTEMNGGEGYSEENGGQETDGENEQRDMEEGHESGNISVQNDENSLAEVQSILHQPNIVESFAISGHQQEKTEVTSAETESDAHQLDDMESSAVSGYQQEETEVPNTETVPQEQGTGEVADISAEATDVDGMESEEESGLGGVVSDAGSEEMLLSINKKQVIVLVSTVLALLVAAATGFLLAKKKAKPVILQHEDGEPTTISDTKETEHVPVEKLIKATLSTLNVPEEQEVDDDGIRVASSVPPELSFSFNNKSLHSCNNRDELKEYQSGGGGRKSNDSGESMASSASEYSIGSASYGSFTTYEKIQRRSGRKEEDIMVTPVRRSSRIRNHQNSGQ